MKHRIFRTSKINEFRLWGLVLTLAGMGMMVLGTAGILMWGLQGRAFAGVFMVLGMIVLLGSVAIYFWAGMLSTSAVVLQCPECGRQTKMLGKTDRCMFCRTILTLDPDKATAEPSLEDNEVQASQLEESK
ncbi:YgzB family protein [Paenibacillus sp. MER TA 81-3]|uniref:YgzB family protein n=1 Tax=Paenibacillus sp. MER TA 81-3 TaxID=2939573 RepID=UPI00203F3905|nr:YgzB family protein [Paenibacillus sp. MER TA 81-3]MCM3341370.1 YgzB family protein [Paenibacillus sp. MER TA 81-3]